MPTGNAVQMYQQSIDNRWKVSTITNKGVCLALCVSWIINKNNGGIANRDFWDWLGVKPNANDGNFQGYTASAPNFLNEQNHVFQMMLGQSLIQDNEPQAERAELTEAMVSYKIESQTQLNHLETVMLDRPSVDRFLRAITKYYFHGQHPEYYHYLNIQGFNKGHAIVCGYQPGGAVYFMDPNQGEISWPGIGSQFPNQSFDDADSKMRRIWDGQEYGTYYSMRVQTYC